MKWLLITPLSVSSHPQLGCQNTELREGLARDGPTLAPPRAWGGDRSDSPMDEVESR